MVREIQLDVRAVKRGSRPLFVADHKKMELDVYLPEGETMVLVVAPIGLPEVLERKHAFGKSRLNELVSKFTGERKALDHLDQGRLQFLANVSMIDIAHVLDRPAFIPELDLKMSAPRAPGQTSQDFDAAFRFDPGSTGAIDLHGAWIEQEGSIARLLRMERDGRTPEASFSRVVARLEHRELGDELAGPDPDQELVVRSPLTRQLPFSYDFQDLKHRTLVFWPRGISSVSTQVEEKLVCAPGQDFAWPTLAAGHERALAALGAAGARIHHVLASRQPKPPSLKYVLPAFAFHTETSKHTVRRTRKSVLAIHMDCDWYDTGNGEKLALVLVRRSTSEMARFDDVREQLGALASFWGADPTKQGQTGLARLPDYLQARHLGGHGGLVDIDLPLPVPANAPPANAALTLALYEPAFCAEAASWRVEIPLVNPSAVSRPFVRFAFCRYQQHALPDLQMSDIAVADYAQLSDEREALVVRDPADHGLIKVTVYGVSFEGGIESAQPRMAGWLERRCARQEDHREAAWVAEGEPKEWPRSVLEGRACWHGELRASDGGRCEHYRVAIVEEESYLREGGKERGGVPVYFDLVQLAD